MTRVEFERWIAGAVDILRGKVDPASYGEIIIGLLFLRLASDYFERECVAVNSGRLPAPKKEIYG